MFKDMEPSLYGAGSAATCVAARRTEDTARVEKNILMTMGRCLERTNVFKEY